MPDRTTMQRAKQKLRRGRSASTAAGEFVREEMHHIRKGKHGARSTRQAIAIGLSKARRAGVPLRPPRGGPERTRRAAVRDYTAGQDRGGRSPSPRRARASRLALRREPHDAASHRSLASQAHGVAARRGRRARLAGPRRGARTKGPAVRKAAARKTAATRKRAAPGSEARDTEPRLRKAVTRKAAATRKRAERGMGTWSAVRLVSAAADVTCRADHTNRARAEL